MKTESSVIDSPLLQPEEDTGHFGNPKCRFTVFYACAIFLITTLPLWLSFIIPGTIAYVNAAVILFFSAVWLSIAFNAVMNFSRMETESSVPILGLTASRTRKFKHIVVVPCYLDPIDVLFDCIGTLLMQRDVDSLVVVVAFEAKTPQLQDKIDSIKAAFEPLFKHLLITIHTVDKIREIAGGCSNKNYALRSAHKYLVSENLLRSHSVTVTTCDTDSLFHPNHFTVLENAYNAENPVLNAPPRMCVWQPPLFYNWDLDQRPFFNRVTGLMRSLMMLGGLIAFNLNPMSIFSYPIELGLKAGFINPRYGVDDIIAKVRWMCATNEQVPVLLLPVPAISGPTIGTSFVMEVKEWSRQIRRWIVGSSESFHYFIIHWRGQPLFAGLWWFFMFFMYYAVLLCCAGLFTVLAGIPLPWVHYPTIDLGIFGKLSLKHIGLVGLILQYLTFGVAFVIDRYAIRLMTVKEDISIFRNIAHWLSAPIVLLQYSLIAFYAIMKFVFVGKGMAKHDMAAKDGLGAVTKATAGQGEVKSTLGAPILDTDPPGPEIEYDDDIIPVEYATRSRSTSLSMDQQARNSFGVRVSETGNYLPPIHTKTDTHSHQPQVPHKELMCELPEKFRFGAYELDVKKYISDRRARCPQV